MALQPPPPLTTDKQRRLCLGAAHVTCATFMAALEARRRWALPLDIDDAAELATLEGQPVSDAGLLASIPRAGNRWGVVRTAPVVAEVVSGLDLVGLIRHRAAAQAGLGAMLVIAFVAIAISRAPGDGSSGALLVPSASLAPTPTAVPTVTPTPSTVSTVAVTPVATVAVTPSLPAPTRATYKVVAGDTLYALAIRWGTSVQAIVDLNGLSSTNLRVGQELLIPPASPPPTLRATPAQS